MTFQNNLADGQGYEDTDGTDDDLTPKVSKRKTPKKRSSENFNAIMSAENKEKYLKLFDMLEI